MGGSASYRRPRNVRCKVAGHGAKCSCPWLKTEDCQIVGLYKEMPRDFAAAGCEELTTCPAMYWHCLDAALKQLRKELFLLGGE